MDLLEAVASGGGDAGGTEYCCCAERNPDGQTALCLE
jgi:hypothetical protein